MAIKLIGIHGLAFRPTAEDLEKLKSASAPEALLKAIETARKPPPPIPVIKNGQLSVECKPVDCDVWLNEKMVGRSSSGRLAEMTLPEGPFTVSATSSNYEAVHDRQETRVRANETTRVEFLFRPSRTALVAAGTKLFHQMLDALGGGTSGAPSEVVRAEGTLSLRESDGRRNNWSVLAWLDNKDGAKFEVTRSREKYRITQTDAGYKWSKSPKSREARELEGAIRLFVEWQISRVVEQLSDARRTMATTSLVPEKGSANVFRAEESSGTLVVTLNSAYQPEAISLESSGLSGGLRMLYSDYIQRGSSFYPKTFQILLPFGSQEIEARFDRVEIPPLQTSNLKTRRKR